MNTNIDILPIHRLLECPRDAVYYLPEGSHMLAPGIYVSPSSTLSEAEIRYKAKAMAVMLRAM